MPHWILEQVVSETREQMKFGPILLANGGANPQGLKVEASYTGDPGIYDEVSVSVFDRSGLCVGDVIVGLSSDGELRVAITANSAGDDNHPISVYPMRSTDDAVVVDHPVSGFALGK